MKIVSLLFLMLFFSLEYYFVEYLRFFEGRGIYLFEIIFVLISLCFFRKSLKLKFLSIKEWAIIGVTATLSGLIISLLARFFQIHVPFNITSVESVLMLILLGPILEELVYRFSLYYYLETIISDRKVLTVFSALLFSFGHLFALNTTPVAFHQFIYFQGFYTFFLGLYLCFDWQKKHNFMREILIHIFFNLGFLLGLLI